LEFYVSHGSVETQLKCGGIFSNCVIAYCPQHVPVNNFENRLIFGEDMENDKVGCFFGTQCFCSSNSVVILFEGLRMRSLVRTL